MFKKCPYSLFSIPILCLLLSALLMVHHIWIGSILLAIGTLLIPACVYFTHRCRPSAVPCAEQERLAELGLLCAGIAHEIKNPLNFVKNFTVLNQELIKELQDAIQQNNAAEIAESFEQIEKNLETVLAHTLRAEFTTETLLKQAAAKQNEPQLTNVNQLLEEYYHYAYHAMRAQHPDFNIHLDKQLDPNLPETKINSSQIGRVFLNIINNALYAIYHKTSNRTQPSLTLHTYLQKNTIQIVIKDNGDGIPNALLKKIMQPLFTTKPAGVGTGLGLPICQEIISKHSGTLEITSQPGHYTQVSILLPVVNDE